MITLKVRAILRELDKTDFCIFSRTPLVLTLDPSKFLIPSSMSVDHPPSTSIMMLYCCTSYPGYCRFISHLRRAYLAVFSSRRLGDRFREHLRDVEKNDKDASKPVARHFNLPNHSKKHMAVCGLSLHLGTTESRKNLEQKFIFQIGTLNPHGINERFSFN